VQQTVAALKHRHPFRVLLKKAAARLSTTRLVPTELKSLSSL